MKLLSFLTALLLVPMTAQAHPQFNRCDTNNDGWVSQNEITYQVQPSFRISAYYSNRPNYQYSNQYSNQYSYQYSNQVVKPRPVANRPNCRWLAKKAFRAADWNGDHRLSNKEYRAARRYVRKHSWGKCSF